MTAEPHRFKRILNNVQTGLQSGLNSVQTSMQRQGNSTFYTASIQQQESQKCGWLKKQGGVVKSWHRRWFTIKGDHMYYFNSNDESKPPLGFIFLPGNKVVEHQFNANESDKFILEIIPGGDRSRMTNNHETYPLAAASDDERKDWVRIIRRVMYAEKGGAIFGQRLSETMKYDYQNGQKKIPYVVEVCVDYISKHGIEVEGIFRLPGRTSAIRQLREMFDCGERPDFVQIDVDINTVASLLKQYLRELPEPIIPVDAYEPVMKAVIRDMPMDREKGLENLTEVLQNLPSYNYNLLQYICRFLYEIHINSDKNKMNDTNLATVFAQCIIRPEDDDPALLMGTAGNRSQVVLVLIQEVSRIFKLEYTPEGTSLVVDNLLNIDYDGNQFNRVSTPFNSLPKSTSLDSDLLGVEFDALGSTNSLPEPLSPSNRQSIVQMRQCVINPSRSRAQNHSVILQEWEQSDNLSEDEYTDDEQIDMPVFGSVRSSRLQSGNAENNVQYQRSNSSSSIKDYRKSITMNTKCLPIPPPRPSKSSNSSQSNNDISQTEYDDDDDDDGVFDTLLSTDLSECSHDELLSYIDMLTAELKIHRVRVKELKYELKTANTEHKQQMNSMKRELELEKTATTQAVEKVMTVQTELQKYRLRYSKLPDE